MAQIIKHRRGSISNVGSLSPVNPGEIILGTGSVGTLNGPVLFVGDSSAYKAVPQLYYGSSAPNISSYSQLEGVSFYDSTGKNLYILKAAGNTRLDLSGAVSGSAITPSSVTTTGDISGSNLYLSGNAVIGGNLTIGDQTTDYVRFAADVSSSIIPDSANNFDLGASGKEWRTLYAQQGIFTSASGSFSGSFVGNGAGLTGLVTALQVSGSVGTGSVDLLTQTLSVLGTTGEIEVNVANQTIQVGLPSYVNVTGDISVGGGNIRNGSGTALITFNGNDVRLESGGAFDVFSGEIRNSGTTAITMSGQDVTVIGDLKVQGNDIKSSTGNVAITLTGSNVILPGDLTVTGSSYIHDLFAHSGSFTHQVTVGNGLIVTGSAIIQNAVSASSGWFSGSVYVGGNLTVNGTSTIVNSTIVEIGDNIIQLNGTGVTNGGLRILDPTSPNLTPGSLLWDTTNDYWKAGAEGSEKRVAVQNASSLTTNALLYGNSSSEIVSMAAPTTSGDIAQWNGSSWSVSNVIDGGTF